MENLNFLDPYESTSDEYHVRLPTGRYVISDAIVSSTSNSTSYYLSPEESERQNECVIITGLFRPTSSHISDTPALPSKRGKQSILKRIAELSKSVPEEAWEKVPTDFSTQKNHYLYGTEKK